MISIKSRLYYDTMLQNGSGSWANNKSIPKNKSSLIRFLKEALSTVDLQEFFICVFDPEKGLKRTSKSYNYKITSSIFCRVLSYASKIRSAGPEEEETFVAPYDLLSNEQRFSRYKRH